MNTARTPPTKPIVEVLEDRNTPSVTLTDSGVLVLTGAETDDSFTVVHVSEHGGEEQDDIIVYETTGGETTTHTFDLHVHDVSSIVFFGLAGNDAFINDSGLRGFAYGGAGNDYIETAGELHGGGDNDYLLGVGGDAYLYGDDGDDTLNTPFGFNHLYGGAGNDTLFGGDSAGTLTEDGFVPVGDVLDGGQGNDILWGRDGTDLLLGGDGRDTLHGGLGDDVLDGGVGWSDELWGDAGADEFRADWAIGLPINRDEPQDYSITELDTVSPEWDSSQLLRLERLPVDLPGVRQLVQPFHFPDL